MNRFNILYNNIIKESSGSNMPVAPIPLAKPGPSGSNMPVAPIPLAKPGPSGSNMPAKTIPLAKPGHSGSNMPAKPIPLAKPGPSGSNPQASQGAPIGDMLYDLITSLEGSGADGRIVIALSDILNELDDIADAAKRSSNSPEVHELVRKLKMD